MPTKPKRQTGLEKEKKHAPDVGVEPTTVGLKVQRSTTELTGLPERVSRIKERR